MVDVNTELARIGLYTDIVKIGIPALAGIAAGLIPYFLERKKLNDSILREQRIFYQSQVIELIDCFSDFSGSYFRYLGYVLSGGMDNAQRREMVYSAGDESLKNEIRLKKARSLAALIGSESLVESLDEFDQESKRALNQVIKSPQMDSNEIIGSVKQKEKKVLSSLNSLIDFKPK